MAYTPKPNREVRGGKAMVSAEELADFRKQFGENMGLRDLLNRDRGLTRRVKNEDLEPPHIDAELGMSRGTRPKQANSTTEAGMANYKPMREPKPLTEVRKPGTNVNYESDEEGMKRGGKVKASKMGSVKTAKPSMGSASRRGDGIAQRGKTKGRYL